jgi:hypothetical protein
MGFVMNPKFKPVIHGFDDLSIYMTFRHIF